MFFKTIKFQALKSFYLYISNGLLSLIRGKSHCRFNSKNPSCTIPDKQYPSVFPIKLATRLHRRDFNSIYKLCIPEIVVYVDF